MHRTREKTVSPELSSSSIPRNFTISTGDALRAIGIGVPAYAARKRKIEDALEDFVDFLAEYEAKLTRAGSLGEARREALTRAARKLDLAPIHRLVEAHNRYYPIEANLPVEPRTGRYIVKRGTPFEPEPEVTVARLLAELDARKTST